MLTIGGSGDEVIDHLRVIYGPQSKRSKRANIDHNILQSTEAGLFALAGQMFNSTGQRSVGTN